MQLTPINANTFSIDAPIKTLTITQIEQLQQLVTANDLPNARICMHPDTDNKIHEMIIVHRQGTLVKPHKQLNKSKSYHVISGCADVFFYDDAGNLQQTLIMGDYASGHAFYYRIEQPLYVGLMARSEFFIFQETINGPFKPGDTVYADWA